MQCMVMPRNLPRTHLIPHYLLMLIKQLRFGLNLVGGAFAGTVESFLVVIPCELLKVINPQHISFALYLLF
jgi:hypothetical protein